MTEDKHFSPVESQAADAASVVGIDAQHLSQADQSPAEAAGQEGRIKKWWGAAVRSGQFALVMAELTPLNEISRLGVYGYTEAMTRDPIAGAAALGLSTLALEGVGGLAAASLMDTDRSTKLVNAVNEKGKKMKVPTDKNLPVATKTGATLMFGTPFGMLLEQRENPNRTKQENRRYALFTSAWQAGVLAVAGAMGSEVVDKVLEDPKTGVLVAAGVGGAAGVGVWFKQKAAIIKSRFSRNKTQ